LWDISVQLTKLNESEMAPEVRVEKEPSGKEESKA